MSDDEQLTTTDEIAPDAVRPVVREGVIILGLIGFVLLGMILPGTGRDLPGTEIGIGELVLGIGTLGIVVSLIYSGPLIRTLIEEGLSGPVEVVENAASIGQYLGVFVAVLIAYRGFAPVLVPVFGLDWLYDIAFLLLALLPLGVIAVRFYDAVDPLAQFLTAELLGTPDGPAEAPGPEDRRG